MDYQERLKKYCNAIKTGRIKSGTYTKKAISRFLKDLERQNDEDFNFVYVPERADEVMTWAESLELPDISGDDKKLKLLDWQIFIYSNLFGWRYKYDEDKRRFRFGYVEVARKNGKTSGLLFPIIIWDFLESDAAESYFVSKDGAQSTKSFKELLFIMKANPELKSIISETVSAITYQNSRISFFSSESTGIDSYKNSLSVIDEYHAYDSDKIVTAFRYGGRARLNNLVLIITSAGNNISGPCYSENERCRKILNGVYSDDTYFGIIYAYDDSDDWKDPKNFIKANPSLGTILQEDVLVNDLNDALSMPSHAPDFQSKTCGIWTSGNSSWISIQSWEYNKNYIIDEEFLLNKECVSALDLSTVNDFTAYTKLFLLEDGKYYLKHKFYIPEGKLTEKYLKENINILGWVNNKFVTTTPGDTIDYEYIYQDIIEDSKKYKLNLLTYDRWGSDSLVKRLEEDLPDLNLVAYNQNEKIIPNTEKLEKLILEKKIVDKNPVMTWMVGNANIKEIGGHYKIVKPSKASTQKIDGVISSIMALSFAEMLEEKDIIYSYEYLKNIV